MNSQPDHNRITLLVVREAGRPVRQLHLSKPLALALPAAAALSLSSLVTSMHIHASRSISELEAEAAALSLKNIRMELKVADKDEALLQLRSQVTELSEEAQSIKDKLKSVTELEQQLQSLIDEETTSSSGNAAGADDTDTTASAPDASRSAKPPLIVAASAKVAVTGAPEESKRTTTAPFLKQQDTDFPTGNLSAIDFRFGAVTTALASTVPLQVGGEYIAMYAEDPLELVQDTKDDFEEIRSMLDKMVNSISSTITEAEEANQLEASLQAQKAREEKARLAPAVIWPTGSKVITSSFGYRSDPFKGVSAYHSGIDIAGSIGDPVYAAMGGVVTSADQMGARGKYIIIKHDNGLETWYMHLNSMNVSPGETVGKGEQIGTLGNTGRSTGPHLHFQIVKGNNPVNPLGYVKP
ncbi:M23 family metallopeptidase [Paenibacillus sp. MMS20-IR301]|uniref:M23 family metallopeptidase n=1 Tax=Paenibacillus sp. MMS20-IR301 TaxID=2895946 RepID=UPI0028ED0206|nr:M23 family metallopeptidase [Paenibacillus sp. MMS20-IR301]WNS41242.1 M23 family metallopeptidase [Paenibacillus sp. MMS20-IR301]